MAVIRTRGPERHLVVRGDAGKVLLHDGAAGGAAVAEGLLSFCDGGFGDLEGLGTGWWLRVCGGGDGEQKCKERTSHASFSICKHYGQIGSQVRYIEVIEIQAEVQLVLRAFEYRSLMHKARAIE